MIETTITTRSERRVRAKPTPRAAIFTVEQAAYLALVGLAFGLRLYALGGRPLAADEAQQALTVWNFARGLVVEPTHYTPPLFYSSLLTLLIAGANDLTARVPALLFGTALVGLPYFLRKWLGRPGALATAALLALSPTLVFFSRTHDEAIVTAALALVLLAAALGYVERPERRRLQWLAVALGAALTAGPGITILLFAALIFVGGAVLVPTTDERPTTNDERRMTNDERLLVVGRWSLVVGRWSLVVGRWSLVASEASSAGGLLVGVFLAMATGLLVNFGGLQAALNSLTAWFPMGESLPTELSSLGAAGLQPLPPLAPLAPLLFFYEPLILALGLTGAGFAVWRRDRFGIFLATWFAAAWLVGTVAHHSPGGVVPVLLPLSLLAGLALGRFAVHLAAQATLELDGLLAGLTGILAAYGLLQLANYADDPQPTLLNLGLVAFAFIVALAVLFALAWGGRVALRGVGVSAVVALAVLTIHSGTWLNYRSQDAPQEWLLPNATSPDVRRLVELMHALSYQRERDPNTMAITVEARLTPVLGWYLRDFEAVTVVNSVGQPFQAASVGPGVQTPLLLVSARAEVAAQPGYVGQRFRLGTYWGEGGEGAKGGLLRWYLFRDAPHSPQPEDAILYVKR